MPLSNTVKIIKEIKSLPTVKICLAGDSYSEELYRSFIKPHPRYKIIQSKKWGVALLNLPDSFEEYVGDHRAKSLRRKRSRALKKGFYCARFSPFENLGEILEINSSAAARQGRCMDSDYTSLEKLKDYFEECPSAYGVFDEDGRLSAYACATTSNEVLIFQRSIGHAMHLNDGIMYLLMSEVIREAINLKATTGKPAWVMFDTMLGASEGLKQFKLTLGFRPYKTLWLWEKAS